MSWQDRVKNNLIINTADGKTYDFPLWINARQNVTWNTSENTFIKVPGQLIDKEEILARKFPLEFFITGPDHLETFGLFLISLNNKGPITIEHPYYDTILCQITELEIDNSQLNSTKINCVAIETITRDGLRITQSPIDAIPLKKIDLDATCEEELTTEPSITDINRLSTVNNQNYKEGLKIISIPEDAEVYFNAFNTAASFVDTITATPILAMRATIALLTLPSKFEASVQERIKTLLACQDNLRRTLSGLFQVPAKQLYQIQGSSLISSLCLAAATPLPGNYTNANSALSIIEQLLAAHRQFLTDLDTLQSPNGGNPEYFIPAYDLISQLNDLVNVTVSNLLEIALNGKQERTVILPDDSNIINIVHKYIGLEDLDSNIDDFINNNDIGIDDLIIGKGRKIVYYV